jgi:hypothetical protein
MVGPTDVQDLQAKVQAYHEALLVALTDLNTAWATGPQASGAPLPTTGKFTQATWDDMTKREEAFLAVSVSELNPLAWVDAANAYETGRGLIGELDGWRDELATLKAPNVPAPIDVPSSKTSLFGDVGTGLMLLIAILALHELKSVT